MFAHVYTQFAFCTLHFTNNNKPILSLSRSICHLDKNELSENKTIKLLSDVQTSIRLKENYRFFKSIVSVIVRSKIKNANFTRLTLLSVKICKNTVLVLVRNHLE